MPNVTTVVVTRNHCDRLIAAIGNITMPVIVVDNASQDGSADAVESAFPDVRVVRMAKDCGIEAFNAGARAASTRYVAFADDSLRWESRTLILGARTLDEHPTLGLIAAAVHDVGHSRTEEVSARLALSHPASRSSMPGIPVLGFSGCACLVRRQPFLDVGGFDNVSGLAGEEQRLALDLADAGWAVRYRADIVAWTDSPSPLARRQVRVRDALLTAVMRRPLQVIWSRVLRNGWPDVAGLVGILKAIPYAPAAFSRRNPVSARVEKQARMRAH